MLCKAGGCSGIRGVYFLLPLLALGLATFLLSAHGGRSQDTGSL